MTKSGLLFLFVLAVVNCQLVAQHRVFLRIISVEDEQKATDALNLLRSGESFDAVARRLSTHPTADRGGYLGETRVDQLSAEFQQVATQLTPSTYSEPLRIGAGLHILYRESEDFREKAYALQRQGERLVAEGRLDQAIESYRKAVEIYPDFIHAYFLMGVAHSRAGRIDKEIESYRTALQIEPGYYQAHYNLGLALMKKDQYPEAIRSLERSVAIKPDYTDCWVSLSAAQLALGQVDAAVRSARRAIDINPVRPESYYNLGAALVRRDPAAGLRQFQIASTLNPGRPDFKMAVAVTTGQLGQQSKAVGLLRQLVRNHPEFEPARQLLSQLGLSPR